MSRYKKGELETRRNKGDREITTKRDAISSPHHFVRGQWIHTAKMRGKRAPSILLMLGG